MTITVNGEARDVPPGATLDQVVRLLTDAPSGVAAAVNGEVVPRRAWAGTPLADRDQVEIVTAVQGG
ncbi:MAG TPA: sulfur carrier protein ThiS [Trebonia sp.]